MGKKSDVPYKPTEVDIEWVRMLEAASNENAVWAWPATGMIYRFEKANKTLVLTNDDLLADPHNVEMHHRCSEVFKAAVGYTVVPKDTLTSTKGQN